MPTAEKQNWSQQESAIRRQRLVTKADADLQRFPSLSMRNPDMSVTATLLRGRAESIRKTHTKDSHQAGSVCVWQLTPMNGRQKGGCTAAGSYPSPQRTPTPHSSRLHWDRWGSEERRGSWSQSRINKYWSVLPAGSCLPPGTGPAMRWGCHSRSRFQTSADSWRVAPQSGRRLAPRREGRAHGSSH